MLVTNRPNGGHFCCLYLFLKTRKYLQCCFCCLQTSVPLILTQVVTDDGMRMVAAVALNAKMKPFLFHLFTIWPNAEIVSHLPSLYFDGWLLVLRSLLVRVVQQRLFKKASNVADFPPCLVKLQPFPKSQYNFELLNMQQNLQKLEI